MSEIKLFDTWTFQEEVPEPFHQLLKKEGLRKTTTTLECAFPVYRKAGRDYRKSLF